MNSRTFALLAGVAFILIGILGFVPAAMTPPVVDPGVTVENNHGMLFGLFPVNALHSAAHIAFGVWALLAYGGFASAIFFARGTAVIYGLLTVMGLVPGLSTAFGLMPLYGHDIWLHALIAGVAAWVGWGPRIPARAVA
jgi:hypothetical protein